MTSDLSRRLVACPGFRWMPRMADTDGNTVLVLSTTEPRLFLSGLHTHGWANSTDCLPDLDDPATLGCVEHGLLPEAWPSSTSFAHVSTGVDGEDWGWTEISDAAGRRLFYKQGPKADRLVLALESAPRRKEGP